LSDSLVFNPRHHPKKTDTKNKTPTLKTKTKIKTLKNCLKTVLKQDTVADCWKHFFSNRVINIWNKLDKQIVGASSLNAFINGLARLRKTQMGFFMD